MWGQRRVSAKRRIKDLEQVRSMLLDRECLKWLEVTVNEKRRRDKTEGARKGFCKKKNQNVLTGCEACYTIVSILSGQKLNSKSLYKSVVFKHGNFKPSLQHLLYEVYNNCTVSISLLHFYFPRKIQSYSIICHACMLEFSYGVLNCTITYSQNAITKNFGYYLFYR